MKIILLTLLMILMVVGCNSPKKIKSDPIVRWLESHDDRFDYLQERDYDLRKMLMEEHRKIWEAIKRLEQK